MPPADPAPAPEWAVEMAFAHAFPADYKASGYAEARRLWAPFEGTADWRRMDRLARLLASVREGALREAATELRKFCGGYYADFVVARILALIEQPPKEGP